MVLICWTAEGLLEAEQAIVGVRSAAQVEPVALTLARPPRRFDKNDGSGPEFTPLLCGSAEMVMSELAAGKKDGGTHHHVPARRIDHTHISTEAVG
jgi:hypothetical protein